ncbi:MAG: D-arabinono-1,4-lactone oxidase [Spirosomataceae bacterium]
MPTLPTPDSTGLYHPQNEAEVISLVQHAIQNKLQVRVRGAAQSVNAGVFTDDFSASSPTSIQSINLQLDQLRSISYDDATMQVTVGAGINLGVDPFDPSGVSFANDGTNNLLYQLNQTKGWALKNVPDVVHQTVAGFISTGSSGGTMQHAFDEAIVSLRMVDGTGTLKEFIKSDNLNDDFYGVVVSMGLMGVITSVTLQCVPAFNIIGTETTTAVADCEFDFLGSGSPQKPSLQEYLSTTEYSRALWWPITSLHRVIAWKAKTMQPSDYDNQTGTPTDFKPNPYYPVFPKILGSRLPSEQIAGIGFSLIASWPKWFYDILGHNPSENSNEDNMLIQAIEAVAPYAYPLLINLYFPVNTATNPPQRFWDYWLGSLPMDTFEFSNNVFTLVYTEFWFPIEQTELVMDTLQEYYTTNGYSATGFYTVEVLAAKRSDFWLSPGYQQDSLRLNIMFFANSTLDPNTYYSQFWTLFRQKGINFRLHWGKNLPPPSSLASPTYLQSQYQKWDDFHCLRKQMDPHDIFLTTYWKTQLGL